MCVFGSSCTLPNCDTKDRIINCNTKDWIPDYLKSHVIYEFSCPACNAGYIGKTDRNLGTRIKEHCGLDKNSPVFNHLAECNFNQYTLTNNMRIIGKSQIGLNFAFWRAWTVSGKSRH